jgi:hypothetical protein
MAAWLPSCAAAAAQRPQRKRMETGKKVGGRKSHAELWREAVTLAKRWRRASPKTGDRLSYRDISVKLADAGYVNEHG